MDAILERKKAAATVVAASRRWAAATADGLAELLRPVLREGEALPDLELLQELFGRVLELHWRRLETADHACGQAGDRHRLRLGERAAATGTLYRRVVDLRALLGGVYGARPARRLLGLAGKTADDPVALERQAEQAVARLRDAASALPSAAYTPTGRNREAWARPVDQAAGVLASARASASLAGKDLDAAAAERRRALAGFNGVFVEVAGWLEATYRAAGRAERAQAVRPSRRRRGVLLQDEDRRRRLAAAGKAKRRPNDGVIPAAPDRQQGSPPDATSRELPAQAEAAAVRIREIA